MPSKSAPRRVAGQHKFSTQKNFPDQEQRTLFWELFCANPWSYIFKPLGDKGSWLTASGKQGQHWSLKPSEAFKAIACQHPRFFIGTRPAKHTRFAVIDIDKLSEYHNQKSLNRIIEILAGAGIERHALYRSSESGGWYLYIFFDEAVSTRQLRAALVQLLIAHGFKIVNGQLEVFPNLGAEGSEGFGLRLPLQPGFAWLDPKTLEVIEEREELSPAEALHRFILDVYDGNEYKHFRALVDTVSRLQSVKEAVQKKVRAASSNVISMRQGDVQAQPEASEEDIATVIEIFGYVPPGMVVSRWVRGREFTYTGLTDYGQRHEASMNRGHYYFYGDPSLDIPALGYAHERERELLVNADLDRLHNGFSQEINRGSSRPGQQIHEMANWLPPARRGHEIAKAEAQPAKPKHRLPPLVLALANVKRSKTARQKITAAAEALLESGVQISLSSLHTESGVAVSTIRKHPDLWKSKQEQQYQDLFAGVSGEFKRVVAEGEPQKAHPQVDTVTKIPAGRLAARQIVSELKMRGARERKKKSKEKNNRLETSGQSWHEQVEKHLPPSIQTADTVYLQFVQALYGVCLATSPDYESQKWLQEIQEEIRLELQQRWTPPEVVPMQTPDAGCAYQPYGVHRLERDTG